MKLAWQLVIVAPFKVCVQRRNLNGFPSSPLGLVLYLPKRNPHSSGEAKAFTTRFFTFMGMYRKVHLLHSSGGHLHLKYGMQFASPSVRRHYQVFISGR